jgi:hypothetical protein
MVSKIPASLMPVIKKQFGDLHATVLDLQDGGVQVYLARWNTDLEQYLPVPGSPFTCTMSYSGRRPDPAVEPSTVSTHVDGSFKHPAPWDVERGDSWSYGDPESIVSGQIMFVPPPHLGIQRADFVANPAET